MVKIMDKKRICAVFMVFMVVLISVLFANFLPAEKIVLSKVELGGKFVNTTQPLGDFVDKNLSDVTSISANGKNKLILFSSTNGFISCENGVENCDGKLVQIFVEIDKDTDIDETISLTYENGSEKTINLRSIWGYVLRLEERSRM